jgi:chaperonin GroES
MQVHVLQYELIQFFCSLGEKMELKPVRDRIVVRRLAPETKTKFGLVIPDSVAEKPNQGEVLATGSGRLTDDGNIIPMEVKVGDRVLFGQGAGQTIKVNQEELHVLKEDEVMAIIE